MRCRSWGCELCQPRRQAQLIALAKSGKPDTFITLTVAPGTGVDAIARARALADAWPKIVKLACKEYGYKSIPYLCVFEATKKGQPHLHILARCKWIDQRWLSTKMKDLIGAPVVDIRRVKNVHHAAHYIAKYCGKEPHRFDTCKRYWRTQSWELTKYVPDSIDGDWNKDWQYHEASQAFLIGMYECLGFVFEDVGGMAVGREPERRWRRFEDATI